MKINHKQTLITCITSALLLSSCTAAASLHGANFLPTKTMKDSGL